MKASSNSQRPNLQPHWKMHGSVGIRMGHQIQEFDLLTLEG